MSFRFENLDEITRRHMLKELEFDISNENLYLSRRFTELGAITYPQLIRDAILNGNETTLSNALREGAYFKQYETSTSSKGKVFQKTVPINTSETFAESEFNRFYIRGLCRRIIEDKLNKRIQAYRAKSVLNPSAESEDKIGTIYDANELLDDLRRNVGVKTETGIPRGPNSGISVKYID